MGAEEVGGGATSDAKRQEVVVLVAERLQPAFEAALAPRRGRRRVEEREGVVRRERRGVRRERRGERRERRAKRMRRRKPTELIYIFICTQKTAERLAVLSRTELACIVYCTNSPNQQRRSTKQLPRSARYHDGIRLLWCDTMMVSV